MSSRSTADGPFEERFDRQAGHFAHAAAEFLGASEREHRREIVDAQLRARARVFIGEEADEDHAVVEVAREDFDAAAHARAGHRVGLRKFHEYRRSGGLEYLAQDLIRHRRYSHKLSTGRYVGYCRLPGGGAITDFTAAGQRLLSALLPWIWHSFL